MRVLIVEDEERIAGDLADAVNSGGYVAEIARDGEDAWFRGGTENYSAIILDLGLPKIDGLTILKRWRQEGLTTPVLVLTARGAWTDRVDGIDAGADDYLPKPFRMEELMARLRALLRRAAGRAEPSISVGRGDARPAQPARHGGGPSGVADAPGIPAAQLSPASPRPRGLAGRTQREPLLA
jgi:two-component system, OmpR family, response regulator